MNPLLPLLSAPAALSAAQSAAHVTRAAAASTIKPFADVLASAIKGESPGAAGARPLPDRVARDTASPVEGPTLELLSQLRESVEQRLGELLYRRNIRPTAETPIRLQIDPASGNVAIESSHPEASWLQGEIASDQGLNRAIQQLARLLNGAEPSAGGDPLAIRVAELVPSSSFSWNERAALRWL